MLRWNRLFVHLFCTRYHRHPHPPHTPTSTEKPHNSLLGLPAFLSPVKMTKQGLAARLDYTYYHHEAPLYMQNTIHNQSLACGTQLFIIGGGGGGIGTV